MRVCVYAVCERHPIVMAMIFFSALVNGWLIDWVGFSGPFARATLLDSRPGRIVVRREIMAPVLYFLRGAVFAMRLLWEDSAHGFALLR